MRDRNDILADGRKKEHLILEVLLDIRDLLKEKTTEKKPVGRPKKTK